MPEPQLSRAEVLAALQRVTQHLGDDAEHPELVETLDNVAAAVAGWCLIEGGHDWSRLRHRTDGTLYPQRCYTCDLRREAGTEGGR